MTMKFDLGKRNIIYKDFTHKNIKVENGSKFFKSSFVRRQGWLLQLLPIEVPEKT